MSDQREIAIAIMEGEMVAAEDEYFKARPGADSVLARRYFQDGFKRGWSRKAAYYTAPSDLQLEGAQPPAPPPPPPLRVIHEGRAPMPSFIRQFFDRRALQQAIEREAQHNDYLARLKRSAETYCGQRFSTLGATLTIEEVRSLLYAELKRRVLASTAGASKHER